MLIRDDSVQIRQNSIAQREAVIAEFERQQMERIIDAVYVDELPTNPEKAGKLMKTIDFEAKLQKLLPNIVIEREPHHNANSTHVACRLPNGSRIVYPFPVIPERSIRDVIYTYRLLPGVVTASPGKPLITRADLPKHVTIPDRFDSSGNLVELGRVEWLEDTPAGMEKVRIPAGEKMRGWRTVLAMIFRQGFCTVEEIEKEFGSLDTKEWANHMGKQVRKMPW